MKRTVLSVPAMCMAIALLFSFASCNKLKDAVKVNVAMQSADISFSIPPQPVGTQTLSSFTATLNVDSIIKANASNMGINNIKSVKITSCSFTLLNADATNNFGALSACQATLSSSSNTTPVTLAEISNNPDANSSSLSLPVNSSVELKNYFSGTSFYYTISGTTRRATTQTMNCTATVKFDVQVGL